MKLSVGTKIGAGAFMGGAVTARIARRAVQGMTPTHAFRTNAPAILRP